jgi:hypothetical protein
MIVSKDEFLLLAQNWKNSSAQLRLVFVHGGKTTPENPVSSALVVKVSARIIEIDEEQSIIACSVGDDGLISIGFEESLIVFGTAEDELFKSLTKLASIEGEVVEMVTIRLDGEMNISFMHFK